MAQKKSGPLFFDERKIKAEKARTKTGARPEAPLQLRVERLSSEGRGLAFHDGKPVFIATALAGETVRARIVNEKREFAEAELLEIIEPAPRRREPVCELFGRCGGCQLQMLDIADQLAHKQQALAHRLKMFVADAQAVWAPPLSAAPWHYRHRARLAVAEHNGKPIVGFKMANSHRVLAVPHCPILDERLQPLLRELPQWLAQLPQWRRIDELLIAVDSDARIGLGWNAQRAFPKADAEKLAALCRAANVATGNDAVLNYAVPSQRSAIAFTPADFTQVNPAVNDRLAAQVLEWLALTATDTVADFFCGLGNFTLPLARSAQTAAGYELNAQMVQRARANARGAGIDNATFAALDLFEPAPEFAPACNKALLDPPRAGAKGLCEKLARLKTLRRIVYVSCNPQTLARDIGILAAGGFHLRRAALVDMFPQTGHSEAVVMLERN